MILALIAALLLGVLSGTITGLFPGIHINLVSAGLLAYIGYFSFVAPLVLAVFVAAMAITHTFIDFIPSVFLGAPEEDSFLSVLPGHQLLLEGRGHEAVVLTLYGSLIALPLILIFGFVFVLSLDFVFGFVREFIAFILIFVSLYLIFREDDSINAFIVFALAGFLGLFSFNLPVKEPLLPLLSGLFGVSGLIVSLRDKVVIPNQKIQKIREVKIGKGNFWKSFFGAGIAAPLCSFLPGIGSGHAAVIGSEISGDDKRGFLFLVGAINTIIMGLSFASAYAIGKTRTGASAAVKEILGEISLWNLIIIFGVIIISGIISFFAGIYISGFFAKNISRLDYSRLSLGIIIVLFTVNFILSNWIGMIVLITSSALGVFSILSKTRRINLMGCLLLPSIVFYSTL
ncbi:MAG: tripartite tricarboxylate transporter permease [Nanoarchaeota archaeon]